MSLQTLLPDYVAAAFSLWIETREPDKAANEIRMAQFHGQGTTLIHEWDIAQGTHTATPAVGRDDPLAPLAIPKPPNVATLLIILHNYHKFLASPVVSQALFNAITAGKGNRTLYIVLAPTAQIPPEVEKIFAVINHNLPTQDDLQSIAFQMDAETNPTDGIDQAVRCLPTVRAAAGLTRYEAEGAFALSIIRQHKLVPETVWELKESMLSKSGLLTLYRGKDKFNDLGGLDCLKQFCKQAIVRSNAVKSRGVLLFGVPGTGKSAFAKALGNEAGRPTLLLDVGSLMGSFVGQTEDRIRQALKITDAMSPCVLFIDEVEKALAGSTSQHPGDSGVSARLLGTLLTWLNDHESDAFVVCTSNDVTKLPTEFSRAERFDAVFFLDLPSQHQRNLIWQQYKSAFNLDSPKGSPQDYIPADDNWTGAEIKACCRLAALLNVPLGQAADYIVPIASTAPENVQGLRQWASGRCLDASTGGIYQHQQPKATTSRRKLQGATI